MTTHQFAISSQISVAAQTTPVAGAHPLASAPPTTFGFRDMDGDTFPDAACCNSDGATMRCGSDCDDLCPTCHPGESEACDLRDNDCNGMIDEGAIMTFYRDAEGDMFGVDGMTTMGCSRPVGYAINGGDCSDIPGTGGGVNPGVPENRCNSVDDDCDGMIDEGGSMVACFTDPDGDEYAAAGAASTMRMGTCNSDETARNPADAASTDCREAPAPGAASVHPLAAEIACNGIDDDCNGDPADTAATCAAGSRTCPAFSIPCTQPCTGSCAYDTQCDATTTTWVWNGSDPALGHGLPPGCGNPFGTAWLAYGPCLAVQYGPYVQLPPGNYRVTFDCVRPTGSTSRSTSFAAGAPRYCPLRTGIGGRVPGSRETATP